MTDAMTDVVSLAHVEAAAELLRGVAIRTAMEESRWLSSLVGGPVLLKCENLQRTGSFKIRGAYVRMSRLSEEERARGVVVYEHAVTDTDVFTAVREERWDDTYLLAYLLARQLHEQRHDFVGVGVGQAIDLRRDGHRPFYIFHEPLRFSRSSRNNSHPSPPTQAAPTIQYQVGKDLHRSGARAAIDAEPWPPRLRS